MVDASIKLVEHPVSVTLNQTAGNVDEVVIIEQCAVGLLSFIMAEYPSGDDQHRLCRRRCGSAAQPVQHGDEARGLPIEYRRHLPVRLGPSIASVRLPLGRQELLDIVRPERRSVRRSKPSGDTGRSLLIGRATAGQDRAGLAQRSAVNGAVAAGRVQYHCGRLSRLQPETPPQQRDQEADAAMSLNATRQSAAGGEHRLDQRGESALVHIIDQNSEGAAERLTRGTAGIREDSLPRLRQQFAGSAVVEQIKMRRQTGLERETAQDRLAEGVDRLDAKAGRRIDNGGEELARADLHIPIGPLTGQFMEAVEELRVIHHRPGAEPVDDTIGHLGRGGASEGDTENPVGRRAVEQKAQNAGGQYGRLAGAG